MPRVDTAPTFIDPLDDEDFDRTARRYPRKVKEVRPDNHRTTETSLADVVGACAKELTGEQIRGFHCLTIAVEEGFGMSWSAESTSRAAHIAAPRMKVVHLKGELGSPDFPQIERMIHWRAIAKLTQNSGLLTSTHLLSRRWIVAIVVAAVVLGAAATLITTMNKGQDPTRIGVQFVVLAIVLAILGLVTKWLSEYLPKPGGSNRLRNATQTDLKAAAEKGGTTYRTLINELATSLAERADNRLLVVDNFGYLDPVTRDTLISYLRRGDLDKAKKERAELWVLFQASNHNFLTIDVLGKTRETPLGLKRTRRFELQNFSAEQRREIALAAGFPERAGWRTVRAIVLDYGSLTEADELIDALQTERVGPNGRASVGTLDVLYLFAISACTGSNPWMYEGELLSSLSEEKALRSRLLRSLLPDVKISRDYLRAAFARLTSQLPSVVENERRGGLKAFRIVPELGLRLEHRASDLGLPDPALVHMFWAHYWFDRRMSQADYVPWLSEVSQHLLGSAHPTDLDRLRPRWNRQNIEKFMRSQFDMSIRLITLSMAACDLQRVPALVRQCLALADSDDPSTRNSLLRRIRKCAWEAYILLNDDDVFTSLLEIAERLSAVTSPVAPGDLEPTAREADTDDTIDLFLASLPGMDAAARHLLGRSMLSDPDASISAFASLRGAWLAASLEPLAGEIVPRLHRIAGTAVLFALSAESVALENASTTGPQELETIDHTTVALGAWTLAVLDRRLYASIEYTTSNLRAQVVDCLVSAFLIGLELSESRREAAESSPVNLVLDVLAEELIVTLVAAALVMRWQLDRVSPQMPSDDLDQLVLEGAAVLQLNHVTENWSDDPRTREAIFSEVERYMVLVQVTWRSLGFNQLAAVMAVRQAQFVGLIREPDEQEAARAIDLVAGDASIPGTVAILGHIVASEVGRVSRQLAAQLLLRAVIGALDLKLGNTLLRELCVLAIWLGHAYQFDVERPVCFLVDEGHSASGLSPLAELLSEIPDSAFDDLCRALCNVLLSDKLAFQRSKILELLKSHAEGLPAREAEAVRPRFALFELETNPTLETVDIDAVLDQWEPRKESFESYAFLIYLLVSHRRSAVLPERLMAEAVHVLRDPMTYNHSTGFVFLALQIFGRSGDHNGDWRPESEESRVAIGAIATTIDSWESVLPARENIRIFQLLSAYDSADDRYPTRLAKWRVIDFEAYGVERLPVLAADGRYFLILWYYYSVFADYGLRAVPHVRALGLTAGEMADELSRWLNRKSLPDALKKDDDSVRLSGDFLRLGYSLFNSRDEQTPAVGMGPATMRQARAAMHGKAQECMQDVYRLIKALPNLPQPIDRILARHQNVVDRAARDN